MRGPDLRALARTTTRSRAPAAVLVVLSACLIPAPARAQAPAPDQVEGRTAPSATAANPDERLQQLEKTLEVQRAQLAEQRQRLEALEALGTAEAPVEIEEATRLSFYGFMDMGVNRLWVDSRAPLAGLVDSHETTFVFGNVNLYLDAQYREDWRALTEVRLTLLPYGHNVALGDPAGGRFVWQDTAVFDSAQPNGNDRPIWSGIIVERALLEWTPKDWFGLKLGYFPTPYGIWNVDHGTPTLIALYLPTFIALQYFPAKQLGLQVAGEVQLGPTDLGYVVYATNGRRTSSLQDPTDDKTLGGRIYLSMKDRWWWRAGLSAYHGHVVQISKTITSFDPFRIATPVQTEFDEQGLAIDLSLDWGPLRARSEAVWHRVVYEPGRRLPVEFAPPGALEPNRISYDAYAMVAWAFKLGLEPYVYVEHQRAAASALTGETTLLLSAGLNVHFTPRTQLKLQVVRIAFSDPPSGPTPYSTGVTGLWSRLVMAF